MPTDPTPPTASSPQPSSPYSGPRPTNPKSHSDWTTKRVPLNEMFSGPHVQYLQSGMPSQAAAFAVRHLGEGASVWVTGGEGIRTAALDTGETRCRDGRRFQFVEFAHLACDRPAHHRRGGGCGEGCVHTTR